MTNLDFRSDTVTQPTQAMRDAMYKAEVGDDVYGDDPTVRKLEEYSAEICGKQAALFVPSGTMGNQLALLTHSRRGEEFIADYNSHIVYYECGGAAVLSAVNARTIKSDNGLLSAEKIRLAIRPDDIHQPPTSLICVENTHNRGGGICYELAELQKIYELANDVNIKVHLDGARIFNAAAAKGYKVAECAANTDSMMFCLSKGLAAPVGSMLVGTNDFIATARRWRKLLGGGMRQAGILAAAGIVALDEMVERLTEDHERARRLAMAGIEMGLEVNIADVQTNIIVFNSKKLGLTASMLQQRLAMNNVLTSCFGEYVLRFVTHYQINDKALSIAIDALEKVIFAR